MLSFDEFSALRRRHRAQEQQQQEQQKRPPEGEEEEEGKQDHQNYSDYGDEDEDEEDFMLSTKQAPPPRPRSSTPTTSSPTPGQEPLASPPSRSPPSSKPPTVSVKVTMPLMTRLGHVIESYEVQVSMITLFFLDIICTVSLLLLDRRPDSQKTIRFVESFSAFTVLVATIEIAILFLAYRTRLFTHFGYVTDMIIQALLLYAEVTQEVRFLGLLRVWRVVRLLNTLLDAARREQEAIKADLEEEKKVSENLRLEVSRQTDTVRREREARKRLNEMLQAYKDEVETLNEALRIAALDVALVAEESGSELEDEVEEPQPSTIFINEDGTFEIK